MDWLILKWGAVKGVADKLLNKVFRMVGKCLDIGGFLYV